MTKIIDILTVDRVSQLDESQAILYKGEVYSYFDQGLTRKVYANASKTKVIKFHIRDGVDYNKEEADVYDSATPEQREQLATTKIEAGIIEQEFCNPIKLDDRSLTIREQLFANQCRQEVGWTATGKLVCFDLSEYKSY